MVPTGLTTLPAQLASQTKLSFTSVLPFSSCCGSESVAGKFGIGYLERIFEAIATRVGGVRAAATSILIVYPGNDVVIPAAL